MQLKKNPLKEKSTFIATIISSEEDNGSMNSLPQSMKNVLRRNNVVLPKNPPRRFTPRKEVDCEAS